MSTTYSLLVSSCKEVSWARRKAPNLYVAIQQDGQAVHRTPVVKRARSPKWEHICILSSDSAITFRLWHDSLFPCRHVCLGAARTDISTLLNVNSEVELVELQLTAEGQESNDRVTGILLVRIVTVTEAAAMAIEHAQQDSGTLGLGARPSALMDTAGTIETTTPAEALKAGLGIIMARLELIVRVGDELSKIHPYANTAWKILTSVYQAVKTQQETNEKISQLVDTMIYVYSFAKETDGLPEKLKNLEDKVLAIVKQTIECALFVREYAGKGFTSNAIRNHWDNADKTIADLSDAFLKLKDSLENSLTVHGVFLSMQGILLSTQILEKVDSLVQAEALKKLNPMEMSATSRPTCLPGTRVDLLQEITDSLMDPSGLSSVLWLSGVAGSGKSTISTTISLSFRGLQRLGAFLFFDRNNPSQSHPDRVIRTLAHSLAHYNPHIGSAISAAVQVNHDIGNTPLQTQFETLLLGPLQAVEHLIQGPILIILDALDECGDSHSRRSLISLISTGFPKLPRLFRFLVTSRRETDLINSFGTRFVEKSVAPGGSANDVTLFLKHEMKRIGHNNDWGSGEWPKENQMETLINLAGGLFIWAATAVRYIDEYRPNERMETIINSNSSALDGLYSIALHSSASWDNSMFAEDAQAVLACIVFGKVLMTNTTIDMLLGSRLRSSDVLKCLGCVVQWKPGCVARILHASFADYITDATRSKGKPWHVNTMFAHQTLAQGCLQILNSQLKFNICGLEDSHVLNVDVPNISHRVTTNILPQLSYSSCFWGAHITGSRFAESILEEINRFFHAQFLFWMEVLSLLDQVAVATGALTAAIKYIKDYKCNNDLENLILDTTKFVSIFAPVIAQCAPHIYLSAVAFAPQESSIAKHFRPWLPNTAHLDGPLNVKWPAMQKIMHGHTDTVVCVDFSSDGMRLASGSQDRTLRVWDTETGALVAGPFTFTGVIRGIHFSPDGTCIALSTHDDQSSTILVCDAETSALVAGPFTCDYVILTLQFSPNGLHVAVTSKDVNSTMHIWNAEKSTLVAGPFTGHRVRCARFSPDGSKIVSGSYQGAVCVWDAKTSALLAGPLDHRGVNCGTCSVDFSPDGTQIASGSSTICIWDAATGTLVAGPFTYRHHRVDTLHFSPDGTRIVSSANDTIRVWDTKTCALVGGPFTVASDGYNTVPVRLSPDGTRIASGSLGGRVSLWDAQTLTNATSIGQPSLVMCIDSSPDSMHIASGNLNTTICVWDVQTGALIAGPFNGHNDRVISLRFSPDGKQIASGSEDTTVRVWEAKTGALITGPMYTEGPVKCICFSSDGALIACGAFGFAEDTIRVWDAHTGALVAGPLLGHMDAVLSICFSADGRQIASGSADKTVRVWDAQTGALIAGPFTDGSAWGSFVQFSPDGKQIISGDTTVQIWDIESGALVAISLAENTCPPECICVSQDGTYVATANDKTICVWATQTGALIAGPFTGPASRIIEICFLHDGKQVVSCAADNTIRMCKVVEMDQGDSPAQTDSLQMSSQQELLVFEFESGWIRNTAGALMLWVPPWLRRGLSLPHNSLVISKQSTTNLDVRQFVHGTEWTKCFNNAPRPF